MIKYKTSEISKQVGFLRKHHRVPTMEEATRAYLEALKGDTDGAIRLLEWRRHCFYVRNEEEAAVMRAIFQFAREVLE